MKTEADVRKMLEIMQALDPEKEARGIVALRWVLDEYPPVEAQESDRKGRK